MHSSAWPVRLLIIVLLGCHGVLLSPQTQRPGCLEVQPNKPARCQTEHQKHPREPNLSTVPYLMEVVSQNTASPCSNSWVVNMETILEHTDDDPSAAEMVRWNRRSIYLVPEGMKQQTKSEAYRPLFVSLGPFHHGDPRLAPMEEHKRRAVLHLVKRARKPLRDFVAAMEAVAGELLDAYGDDLGEQWRSGVGGTGRDRFLEVMLTDGCFLLEMMRTRERVLQGKKRVKEYAPNDPIFSIHGFYFVLPDIHSDLLLMENQLPLLVLQRILVVQHGTSAPVCE